MEAGVAYVRRGGKRIGLLLYDGNTDKTTSADLTLFSEHICSPGIVELSTVTIPETLLLAVRSDGQLLSCTLDLANGVISWGRHIMGAGGLVESVAVIRGSLEDEIYVSVNRGGSRTVEYMAAREFADQVDCHFVDCGLDKTLAPPSQTVTGLSHLEGKEVVAIGDGAALPVKTVASGQVVYDRVIERIHIGYSFTPMVKPVPLTIPVDNAGGASKKRRIAKMKIRLYKSLGGKIGNDEATAENLIYRVAGDNLGEAVPLFTGIKERSFPGKTKDETDIVIFQNQPFPLTVLAIIPEIEVMV